MGASLDCANLFDAIQVIWGHIMAADTIEPDDAVESVEGVGPARGEDLREAGFARVEHLQLASVDELTEVVRPDVARQVKDIVGDKTKPITSIAEAKDEAQKNAGAKAKVVRRSDGSQEARVIEKVADERTSGAHMTVRKG